MGRNRRKSWAIKWCSFFASVAFLAVATGDSDVPHVTPVNSEHNADAKPVEAGFSSKEKNDLLVEETFRKACANVAENNRKRFLMLVSTLDGKVSALNLEKDGELEWTINTGGRHMLSSSISKLEVNRDGRKTRLIPSLDGGLYQYDGDTVEPVPFNADTLLSSSFKLNDNSIVVGGKETETYGIDVKSGRVKYICDMNGCKIFDKSEKASQDSEETLVVSRNTKTVRAVEMSSGGEKWNFSVGQHEIAYIAKTKQESKREPAITNEAVEMHYDYDYNEEDLDIDIGACFEEFIEEDILFNFPWWSENSDVHPKDVDLKVIVPKGLVIAVSKSNPDIVLWQHKFSTPIANAWTLMDGSLNEIDLFDGNNNPALSRESETTTACPDSGDDEHIPDVPALYIGSHEKQLYVQPSVQMIQAVEAQINQAVLRGERYPVSMPSVNWKPYIATAPSRTPAEINHPLQITWVDGIPYDQNSVAIWREYPYDVGYYLFPEFTPMKLNPTSGNNGSGDGADDFYFDIPVLTLTHWWKEVLAISLFSTVLLNVFIMKVIRPKTKTIIVKESSDATEKSEESTKLDDSSGGANGIKGKTLVEDKQGEYQSRYYTDFEQISCLGKGGFGVVFQTRNRLDDCDYAVKRITLHNSDKAREKVIREVKALAKLDHSGIVRFYQAWLETPPPGWQEEKDRTELHDVSFSPTPGYIITEYTPSPQNTHHDEEEKNNRAQLKSDIPPNAFNPLRPFGNGDMSESLSHHHRGGEDTCDSDIIFGDTSDTYQLKRNGSTEPFVPHGYDIESDVNDESFCFGVGWQRGDKNHESEDENETGDLSFMSEYTPANCRNRKISTPFKKYSTDSSVHSNLSNKNSKPIACSTVLEHKNENSFDIVFEDSGCSEKCYDESTYDHGHAVIDVNTSGTSENFSSSQSHGFTSPERPNSLELNSHKQNADSKKEEPVPQCKLYLYIQMQLCKKESLKDWLACNTLNRDRSQLLDIFDQIVSAMDYVHDSGLMHRDLKPSNIFFSMDGSIKIGDFGLVTALEECGNMSDAIGIVRTPASVYFNNHTDQVGTKLYMSPEQIEGRNYTHKVDIYAVGLIFFELFYPFATQMERVRTLLEVKRLLFPVRFQMELHKECEFVKDLLSPQPEKRPTTKNILNHTLLQDFQNARLIVSRMRSTSRTRTFSQSSKDSNPSTANVTASSTL